MKDDALISVLIPAYNHENYIQDTIDSVIRQTYNNIELIILDDGSSDNTLAKIKEYESKCQKRFKRFLYSTQKNQATVKTLNSLLSKAKGEYIAMIASDDMYYDEALELELEELKKDPNVSLVTGRSLYINSQGKVCYLNSKQQLTVSISCAKWKDYNDYVSSTRSVDYLSNNFGSYDRYRPIFWFSDKDKLEYIKLFNLSNSKCYSLYGLQRTGCCGCPFGRNFEYELQILEKFEPKLYKAVINIFKESYNYTKMYKEFKR